MPPYGITMPVLGTPIRRFGEFAALAERAGFESCWTYEFFRNPFVMLAEAAITTKRIMLGTGIASAFARSPFVMANSAADIDELSGGRAVLGVGTGAPEFLEAWHSTSAAKPLSRMGEYLDAVRAAWGYVGQDADWREASGEHYRVTRLALDTWGGRHMERARIPLYMGGMRPRMMQLAGERADGLLGFLHTPGYVRDVAHPNMLKGVRRAGRDPRAVDHLGMVICSVARDRGEALRRARIQVGLYAANPVCDAPVRHHGLQAEQQALREAILTRGVESLADVTDDKLVEALSFTGTPEEVRAQVADYPHELSRLIFHTPYVPPLTSEETEDAYRNIVDCFAD